MIFVPANAKLNLALSVVSRRGDGRHELCSVVVHLDWHDLVGLRTRPAATAGVHLAVSGPYASSTPADDNLAARAVRAVMGDATGIVDVRLVKRLPVAAGLGGGSADAAAVLRQFGLAHGEPARWDWLFKVADGLGGDVPACLAGGDVLVTGAGERLQRLPHRPLHLAVAIAGTSGTAATFAALRPAEWRGPDRPERLAELLSRAEPLPPDLCGSDLEAAACRAHPDLGVGLERLRTTVAGAPWHLTGSGGAVFALATGRGAAEALAAAASSAGFPARACRTVAAYPGMGLPR